MKKIGIFFATAVGLGLLGFVASSSVADRAGQPLPAPAAADGETLPVPVITIEEIPAKATVAEPGAEPLTLAPAGTLDELAVVAARAKT